MRERKDKTSERTSSFFWLPEDRKEENIKKILPVQKYLQNKHHKLKPGKNSQTRQTIR